MDFTGLIKNRRSIRNFQKKTIPLETITSIINDSVLAPSAGNGQPWKFIVVNNQDMLNRISDECKKNILARIASNPNDYAKRYEKMLQNESFHIFYHAPAVIFILGEAGQKNLFVDCALAASYIMFSATSRGLGTCWVNFATAVHYSNITTELGIPEKNIIVAPIAIGYPEKIPNVPNRKDPEILKVID